MDLIRAINPVWYGNAPQKSSEVSIPVLEHGMLHFGSGRVSMLKIMIKTTDLIRATNPRLLWKRTKKVVWINYSCFTTMFSYTLTVVAFPIWTLWLQSQLAHGPH